MSFAPDAARGLRHVFVRGLTVVVPGARILDVRVGTSRVAQPQAWADPVYRLELQGDQLVPLNRKYPIAELLAACQRYLAAAPRDFITFEYCMLEGVNDEPAQAQALLRLVGEQGPVGRVPCKFNLIPFNPFPASGLRRSTAQRVQAFAKVLIEGGLVTTVRKTRGDDIDAACGQLAGEVMDRTDVGRRMTRATIPIRQQESTATENRP